MAGLEAWAPVYPPTVTSAVWSCLRKGKMRVRDLVPINRKDTGRLQLGPEVNGWRTPEGSVPCLGAVVPRQAWVRVAVSLENGERDVTV